MGLVHCSKKDSTALGYAQHDRMVAEPPMGEQRSDNPKKSLRNYNFEFCRPTQHAKMLWKRATAKATAKAAAKAAKAAAKAAAWCGPLLPCGGCVVNLPVDNRKIATKKVNVLRQIAIALRDAFDVNTKATQIFTLDDISHPLFLVTIRLELQRLIVRTGNVIKVFISV